MAIQKKETKKFITDSPKTNFWFGLILGIAIISTLAYFTNGFSFINNNSEKNQQQVAGEQQKSTQVNLEIAEGDHVLGNPDASIKVFEFSDFQCPYCSMFHNTMHQIVDEHSDQVAWVYKQFPIASHPLGMPGALATECAAEQGKFWEMSDIIFANQDTLTEDSFAEFAEELDLDMEEYNTCYSEQKYKEKILVDYNLGIESGVGGTPTNFVNGEILPGAVPYEDMKRIIEDLL